MLNKEMIKEILASNEDFIMSNVRMIVKRKDIILPRLNKIVVFYGVRRSGKTHILFHLFKKYKAAALYIDFEDERLIDFKIGDFQRLKEAFLELKPHLAGKNLVFLFDEVQNVKGWERFSRRAVERENVRIFVTGSSSKIMPAEFHTSLRGRTWSVEISPFSFKELLNIKKIDIENKSFLYGQKKPLVKKYFSEYLKWGGFPEVILSDSEFEKNKIIKEYLEAMFFKDIVERFNVSNIHLLDVFKDKIFSSFAQKLSISACYRQFKEKFSLSKDSLFAYYRYFIESMLMFEIRKFAESSYKRLRNPAKIYLADTGIARRVTSSDFGRLLENVVFLELRKKSDEIFYFEEKRECDFIVKMGNGEFLAYQVTWELNEENESREIEGLMEACKALHIKRGIIFTYDQSGRRKNQNIEIEIKPVWKWLLMD